MERLTVGVASLGCAKNLVDTENMLGLLQGAGYAITGDARAADIVVVNTCGFIEKAKEESLETVFSFARLKKTGRCRALIMTGCLAQRYACQLASELPEVDAILGSGAYEQLPSIIGRVLGGERVIAVGAPGFLLEKAPRVLATPKYTAYLKIAEGCNHSCAFCAIPGMRGPYRSRSIPSLAAEAAELAAGGVHELAVIAQDTTEYGHDLAGRHLLGDLLAELSSIAGLRWIRVLYSYPAEGLEQLLGAMEHSAKVVPYLDLPLQHANSTLLARVGRRGNGTEYAELISAARKRVPGLVVRSTFIAGLPGESEADFAELLTFLEKVRLDHVGVFAYSAEEGTRAATLPDQVPAEIAAARVDRAMQLQQRISRELNAARVGQIEEVLSEGEAGGRSIGRSYREAPEIDGTVILSQTVPAGVFCRVRITHAEPYDVYGEVEEVLP